MKNTDFTLVQLGGKRSNEAERHINREERAREEREGRVYTACPFEPVSPCWAEFDIQTMRQGSTQGGRAPPAILTLIWRAAVAMSMKH